MRKIFESKIFWSVLIIIFLGGAISFRFFNKEKKVEYTFQEVKIGDIVQTVSATGQVKSASEIELNFKNPGQLAVLNVKKGDLVSAGQILAQQKAGDLAANVRRAQANVEEAKANLDKLIAGSTKEDVAVYEAIGERYKTELLNAQSDLTNIEKTNSQNLQNERQNMLNDIDSVLTKANISLQKVYDTLNYEGSTNNFVTLNTSLHQKVSSEYSSTLTKVDEAEFVYNFTKLDPQDNNINESTDKTQTALLAVKETVDDLSRLLDYAVITSVLTQSELDTLKISINTERTTTNSSISTVQTGKQDLADARLTYQTKVAAAQNAVAVAEKNLAKAQADLDLKKAPARPEDIALAKARLRQAQADLQLNQDKYNETILRAPIAGIIVEVNFDVGEQTSLSQPAIKMLAKENYEIDVDIPESDITKIEINDQSNITLDAFSDADIFSGIVTTINPAQTEIQEVIYYKVTVVFKDEQPSAVIKLKDKIKPGMTANITIQTEKIENVLFIPFRAVKEKPGKTFVQILENNNPKEVAVVLGLRGDEGLVEVISGLMEGQKVITFTPTPR